MTTPMPPATATWVQFSHRNGRAEISTALAAAHLAEAERVGHEVTVDGRRFTITLPAGGEQVTYTPAHAHRPPAAWEWRLLERLAANPSCTVEHDRSGRARLRVAGARLDRAATAAVLDRGWVDLTGERAAVTVIGLRMLDHRRRGMPAAHGRTAWWNGLDNTPATTRQQAAPNRENALV